MPSCDSLRTSLIDSFVSRAPTHGFPARKAPARGFAFDARIGATESVVSRRRPAHAIPIGELVHAPVVQRSCQRAPPEAGRPRCRRQEARGAAGAAAVRRPGELRGMKALR